jgi:hypothetical protein
MGDFEHFPRRAFLGIYERLNKMWSLPARKGTSFWAPFMI